MKIRNSYHFILWIISSCILLAIVYTECNKPNKTILLHCSSVYGYTADSTLNSRLVDTTINLNLSNKKWVMSATQEMDTYILEDSTSIIYFHGKLEKVEIPSLNGCGNIYCK